MIEDMSEQVVELVPAKNGVLRSPITGRIVSARGIANPITRENSNAFHRLREEKKERLIRAQLHKRTPSARDGYDAVAIASGDLWEQVVLDKDEDAEKRRKMYLSIGKQAGVLTDVVQTSDNNGSSITLAGGDVSTLLEMVAKVLDAKRDTR